MIIKIWQRYLFREFLKVFFLFLVGFYFLYVLIDYSTHLQDFTQGKGIPTSKICLYYLLQFFKRADILFPLGLLIATIKILCQFNLNKELLAFQTAGIYQKTFVIPIFIMGIAATFGTLVINEFAVPCSLNYIDKFHNNYLRHSHRGKRAEPIHVSQLDDHSKLVYQYYDTAKEALFDVIWIRSADDIWRMKYLKTDPQRPVGEWVDHLMRNPSGALEKIESYPVYSFSHLSWGPSLPRKGYIPFENRSLRELKKLIQNRSLLSSFEMQELITQYLFKWAMPFLNLLVIIAAIPFCVRHQHSFSQFFIYTLAIFGFVTFVALMDAAVILAENDTVSPYVAILSPFILLFSIFGWRFARNS